VTFSLELSFERTAPFLSSNGRQIFFVTQQIVDHEYPGFVDPLLNRFVATEGLVAKRKGEWARGVVVNKFLGHWF
jgi:hypothetical protein